MPGEFNEEEHPREEAGQFTAGGGAAPGKAADKGGGALAQSAKAAQVVASVSAKAPKAGAAPAEHQEHAERLKGAHGVAKAAAKGRAEAAKEALDKGKFKESTEHSNKALEHLEQARGLHEKAKEHEEKGKPAAGHGEGKPHGEKPHGKEGEGHGKEGHGKGGHEHGLLAKWAEKAGEFAREQIEHDVVNEAIGHIHG